MVWDVLNLLLQTVINVFHVWMAFLPQSPIYISAGDIAAVAGIAGYGAFWLPLPAMVATFVLFIAGLITWISVLLVIQLVEAMTP